LFPVITNASASSLRDSTNKNNTVSLEMLCYLYTIVQMCVNVNNRQNQLCTSVHNIQNVSKRLLKN